MTTSPFIQNVVCRLLEYVSTKSIQSLNNEGIRYDKYHPYPTAKKTAGSDYRSACRNKKQKQIYGPNNNQARDTTMKNLWKRQPRKSCQFKGLGDDPYRNYLP